MWAARVQGHLQNKGKCVIAVLAQTCVFSHKPAAVSLWVAGVFRSVWRAGSAHTMASLPRCGTVACVVTAP